MLKKIDESKWLKNIIPTALSSIIMLILMSGVFMALKLVNVHLGTSPVRLQLRARDVLIGSTIYLKTAVDFAILMALFMKFNPGWRSRIAIELGTGIGNALGTLLVAIIWIFFKEIRLLLALMILFASVVLIELAADTVGHLQHWDRNTWIEKTLYTTFLTTVQFLQKIFKKTSLHKIIPSVVISAKKHQSLKTLFFTSLSVPFILGMDDFAGYVPLFNVVNLFGFAIGVIAAHNVLNTLLFLFPKKTVAIMRKPLIAFSGGVVFLGLALYGFYEGFGILLHLKLRI